MPISIDNRTEWLEADGLGGYASGTTCGERTRRYHALLLTATKPPIGRMVLVNGLEAWVETPAGRFAISSQRYSPDVVYPDGATRISGFEIEPWPKWTFRFPDCGEVVQELFVPHDTSACILRWRFVPALSGQSLPPSPFGRGVGGEAPIPGRRTRGTLTLALSQREREQAKPTWRRRQH